MPAPQATSPFTMGLWFANNYTALKSKAAEAQSSVNTNTARPVAVFDFDNTCIFRDVGQAVFRLQVFALQYKIAPSTFASLLPPALESDKALPESLPLLQTLEGKPYAPIRQQLLRDYTYLWDALCAGQESQAKKSKEYKCFTTLFIWFVQAARKDERLGPTYALPLLTRLLAGHSVQELEDLTREWLQIMRTEPLQTEQVSCEFPEPIGAIRTSFELGLQPYQEMIALQIYLQEQGIPCYIISASTQWLVQSAVRILGFPVDQEHIYGIRMRLAADTTLTTQKEEGYPLTYRQGKADIIAKFIPGKIFLAAGDADTDYEMLTKPEPEILLIINRQQRGIISSLYEAPQTLLQGINQSTGRFRPHQTSV